MAFDVNYEHISISCFILCYQPYYSKDQLAVAFPSFYVEALGTFLDEIVNVLRKKI